MKKYKPRFHRPFMLVSLTGVTLGSFVMILMDGRNIAWSAMLFGNLCSVVFSLIVTLTLCSYYAVTIKEEGIRGYNFWGFFHFVEWKRVSRCKRCSFLFLPYLKMYYEAAYLPLWIPLFLNDIDEVLVEIEKSVPFLGGKAQPTNEG